MFGARAGAIVIGALASLAAPAPGAYAEGVRNVLELFTSQGCSSCPPADRILSQLSRDPSVHELALASEYLGTGKMADYAHALLCTNEVIFWP